MKRSKQPLFAALIALALFMRVAVPAGFMPAFDGDRIVVTICADGAMRTQVIDLGKGGAPEKPGHADAPCLYAGLSGGDLAERQLPQVAPPLFVIAPQVARTSIADLTVHRLAAPPPPSQGPPAQA